MSRSLILFLLILLTPATTSAQERMVVEPAHPWLNLLALLVAAASLLAIWKWLESKEPKE